MEEIRPEIHHLIEKLIMAEEIFSRAALKVHNEPMTKYLKVIADRKKVFLYDLTKLLQLDSDQIKLNTKDRIRVQLEKLGLEVDNILLRLNDGEVLSFCIKREEELVSMYHNALIKDQDESLVTALILHQLKESKEELDELILKKEPYNFPKADINKSS